jgi:hypothetical protein
MRNWFNGRSQREQALVAIFILLGAAVWLLSSVGRLRRAVEAWHSVRLEQSAQQLWLNRQGEIQQRSVAAAGDLDPTRTYDATGLVSAISSMAKHAGLAPVVDAATSRKTPPLAHHTARVTFRRAGLPALVRFYDEVTRQAPYLSLDEVAIQTDRSGPGLVNVTLQISATQVLRP